MLPDISHLTHIQLPFLGLYTRRHKRDVSIYAPLKNVQEEFTKEKPVCPEEAHKRLSKGGLFKVAVPVKFFCLD